MSTRRKRRSRLKDPTVLCLTRDEQTAPVRLKARRRPVAGEMGGILDLKNERMPFELLTDVTEAVRSLDLVKQQTRGSFTFETPTLTVTEPEPRMEIRVRAIYAVDEGETPPITEQQGRERVAVMVEEGNRDLVGTGIRLVFFPTADFEFRKKAELRRQFALTDEEIEQFKNSTINEADGDKLRAEAEGRAHEARNKAGAEDPTRMLWLFSRGNNVVKVLDGDGKFTGWEVHDSRSGSFSGIWRRFAMLNAAFLANFPNAHDDASRAIHETGHYLGLPHTHREDPPLHDRDKILTKKEKEGTPAEQLKAWRAHAAKWIHGAAPNVTTPHKALATYDNDRSAQVFDTPADPGAGIIALANEAAENGDDDALGPVDSISLKVSGVGPAVVMKPQRRNVMGYYLNQSTTDAMHFSGDQIDVMRKILLEDARRHDLVSAQLGETASPDITICAVWSPSTKSQRFTWNRSGDAHEAEHKKMTEKGFVMVHQQSYTRKGEVRYDGLWNPGTQKQDIAWGWLDTDVQDDQSAKAKAGFRPLRVQGYQHLKEGIRYNVIYQPARGESQVLLGLTKQQLASEWKTAKTKLNMTCLAAHADKSGNVFYSTVLRPGSKEQDWVANKSIGQIAKEYDTRWQDGWRIRDITVVKTADGPRWSVLFEKENAGQAVWWGHVREWIAEVYSRMWAGDMKLRTFSVFPS